MNASMLSRLMCCLIGLSSVGAAWADGLVATPGQRVAVPSYVAPATEDWSRLESGAPTVGIAIINPASGPGRHFSQAYLDETRRAQARGILVLGYVHTSYGAQTDTVVKGQVQRYFSWYGVDGIFFDEASTDCALLGYYQALYDDVKSRNSSAKVVLNPGSVTQECYVSASDILVNFEDTYSTYLTWQPLGWELSYPPERFWNLIINTPPELLPDAVALSRTHNVGWVYVTSDTFPNPWAGLPSDPYWGNELQLVGQ